MFTIRWILPGDTQRAAMTRDESFAFKNDALKAIKSTPNTSIGKFIENGKKFYIVQMKKQ